jgi:hypothetical protein
MRERIEEPSRGILFRLFNKKATTVRGSPWWLGFLDFSLAGLKPPLPLAA